MHTVTTAGGEGRPCEAEQFTWWSIDSFGPEIEIGAGGDLVYELELPKEAHGAVRDFLRAERIHMAEVTLVAEGWTPDDQIKAKLKASQTLYYDIATPPILQLAKDAVRKIGLPEDARILGASRKGECVIGEVHWTVTWPARTNPTATTEVTVTAVKEQVQLAMAFTCDECNSEAYLTTDIDRTGPDEDVLDVIRGAGFAIRDTRTEDDELRATVTFDATIQRWETDVTDWEYVDENGANLDDYLTFNRVLDCTCPHIAEAGNPQ